MAEKELGYVELEWTCPGCNTRNPGSARKCKQCGMPMPEGVKFEQAAQEQLITDKDKLAAAKAAPDIYCGYCGTRNSSTATVCRQCGAQLSEGKARETQGVIGGLREKPAPPQKCPSCGAENAPDALKCSKCGAPLGKAAPAPAPAPPGRTGFPVVAVVLGVLVLAAIIFLIASASKRSDALATVSESRWRRSVAVEALTPVTREAWRDQAPQGAELIGCRKEVFQVVDQPQGDSREVCGTPYVEDTGTGYGKVKQDCKYEVLADYCQYRVLAWVAVAPLVLEGRDPNPRWPEIRLGKDQRAGNRSQEYVIVFRANDRDYSYSTSSEDEYRRLASGERWRLTVNGLGQITDINTP